MIFFFLREAFYGLKYAENVFVDPTAETLDVLPNSLIGWDKTPISNPHPTEEKARNL